VDLRVIIDGARDPRVNMAIDEAILLLRDRVGYDTLRIYMWRPTGVSIGRGQVLDRAVNLDYVKRAGYIIVRRPTGGRALLHVDGGEVTYSIVLSRDNPLYNLSVDESARRIAGGVARALRLLGLDAGVGGFRGYNGEELCYLREGSSDVTVGGVKVSGSAQVRVGGGLLQHGTLLLDFDAGEWVRVIRTTVDRGVLERSVGGLRRLGFNPGLGEVFEALVMGFVEELGYTGYTISGLTPLEVEAAERLYRAKYSSGLWNIHGYTG